MKHLSLFFSLLIFDTAFANQTNTDKKNTPYSIMLQKRAEILGIPAPKPLSDLEMAIQNLDGLQEQLDKLTSQLGAL